MQIGIAVRIMTERIFLHYLRQLGNIRRNPSRLIAREQLGAAVVHSMAKRGAILGITAKARP